MEFPTLVWPDVVLLPGESVPLCLRDLSDVNISPNCPLYVVQAGVLIEGTLGALIEVRLSNQASADEEEPEVKAEVVGVVSIRQWRRGGQTHLIIAMADLLDQRESSNRSTLPYKCHAGDYYYSNATNRLLPQVRMEIIFNISLNR